jgi:uncharacterized protein (TIGR02246 family)
LAEEVTLDASSPEHVVYLLDEAFNSKDIEAVLRFYEDAAVVVTAPGKTARGRSELRAFFENVMASNVSAKQIKTHTIEAGGVALFLSRWKHVTESPQGQTVENQFVATTVFRKQDDGSWKALIDNSFGPLVLETE